MEDRNLRTRRYLQAESILNNLKHKSIRTGTGGSKKIRKSKKKTSTRKSSQNSVQSVNVLAYKDANGELKRVEFILAPAVQQGTPVAPEPINDHVSISDMFLRTYKQLMQSNIITDNFYGSVAYDKDKNSIFLFNNEQDDYFEIYDGGYNQKDDRAKVQDLMKPAEFKTLVKDYNLNNLYC